MGVNCRLELPANTRIRDVMTVMSRLVGHEVTKFEFECGGGAKAWSARCDGVKATTYDNPELVYLRWNDSTGLTREAPWYFEGPNGTRLLFPKSTAFWCALCEKLVMFFGGKLVYSDVYDEPDVTMEDRSFDSNDNDSWQTFQERVMELKPLSKKNLADKADVAAYKEDEYTYKFDDASYMTL